MTPFRWTTVAVLALLAGSGLGLGSATADRVTLEARPLVVPSRGERVTLTGSVSNARAGEDVKIQAKDCGRDFFRVVSGAVTREGGSWFQYYWPSSTTTLRAIWNNATSAEVTIRRRALVSLQKRSAGRIEVRAWTRSPWRKRVFIQRFDRRLGTWRAVKTVVLTEPSYRGTAFATFTVRLSKGTRVRAFFPRSQAGPCYLDGTSNTLTT